MNWSYTYTPEIWPALIVLFVVAYLGWYSWQRRSILAARYFSIGCFLGVLWALGSALEISALDPSTQIFWVKFQVVWFVPIGTAMPCFILVYAGLGRWLTRRNLILLSIPPLIFFGLILTNNLHQLVWTGFQLEKYIEPSPGLANQLFISYVYLIGLIMFAILIQLAIRYPQHRRPALIMLSGQIIGRLVYLIDYLSGGFLGPGESLMVVLGVTSTSYGFAFFRFHVLDPIPLARSAVIDQMQEGMLVLDMQGRIVGLNPAAIEILGNSEANLQGRNIKELLSADLNLDGINEDITSSLEISLGNADNLRYYKVDTTSLLDKYNHMLGYLILLDDITKQKQAQVQMLERQQVLATLQERERLARELHDGIGQVLAYLGMQAQTIRKYLKDSNTDRADSLLERLVEIAQNAHADVRESILNLRIDSTRDWSFISALKQYLINFQVNYGIHTELITTDGIGDNAFDPGAGAQLLRVIQETLTNTRKHSNAGNVRVTIEQTGSDRHIIIKDDGCGFDVDQSDATNDGHFGLVFMRERMEQIGGSLNIDSTPGEGTIVILYVPVREQMEETK